MIVLVFSYFKNSVTNTVLDILLLLTAFSVLLVLARMLVYAANNHRMRETAKELETQMEIQRREYESICKKMELGRAYRHDMRHHLAVLAELADTENNKELTQYMESLRRQFHETEKVFWCENTTVNAVLSSYISQAEGYGCTVTAKIRIPSEIPFDPLDICAILGNALENAFHACQNNPAPDKRRIQLTAVLAEDRKFIISIQNPCETSPKFDKKGFPVSSKKDGHGIGLRSIEAITRKYNGMFQCECKDRIFRLSAVLFNSQKMASYKKADAVHRRVLTSMSLLCLVFCLAVNSFPVMAQKLKGIPLLGFLVQVVDFKNYDLGWGSTNLSAILPKVELVDAADGNNSEVQPSEAEVKSTRSKANVAGLSGKAEKEDTENAQEAEEKVKDSQDTASQTINIPSGAISWEGRTDNASSENFNQEQGSYDYGSGQGADSWEYDKSGQTGQDFHIPTTKPDLSDGIEEINRKMDEYVNELRGRFLWYLGRKFEGYVGMDIVYDVLRNDDTLLTLRFDATLNAGGSGQYSQYFMLDKRTGKVLELRDMFAQGSDYIGVISSEIKRQMIKLLNEGVYDYFISGSNWPESVWFEAIAADQNFYINDNSKLVIVFDEYEVASGRAGRPEFIIPTNVVGSILQQPSLLE